MPLIPDDETACADTRRWLERAVIGLNLCPFARGVSVKGQIHMAVARGSDPEVLVQALTGELRALQNLDADIRDTTLLIHPRRGSYFFLGGIATSLELPTIPERGQEPDHCGTCTRCIDACPTRAITPYSVDASRCISYLTIEHRGVIEPEFHASMGDWLFGCDVCQEVCPHNSARANHAQANAAGHDDDARAANAALNERGSGEDRVTGSACAEYREARRSLPLLDVLGWKAEDRSRVLSGSAMKRATLAMLRRNAIIVAANTLHDQERVALVARLREIAGDDGEDALVRETAKQTLERMEAQR